VAVTRNVTLAPKLTDWLRGCEVIVGGAVCACPNSTGKHGRTRS